MTDKITYKKPLYVSAWLNAALKKEWQKYAATPVTPDMMPGHEAAQAWGFVVAGYFLIEQGLKRCCTCAVANHRRHTRYPSCLPDCLRRTRTCCKHIMTTSATRFPV